MKKCVILMAMLASASAAASDTYIRNGQIYSHEGQWVAEAGVGVTSKLYKGQDDTVFPVLNVGYHGEDFNADVAGINYRFLGNTGDVFNMNAFIDSAGTGYDDKDAKVLKGMKDRDFSVDLGLNIDLSFGGGTFSTYLQHDVAGAYKGMVGGTRYAQVISLGALDFVPYAGVAWLSKDYVDYYFGVRKNEATATRKAYKGDSSLSYEVGYKLVLPLSPNWELTQSTNYVRLGKDVSDSPLVKSANQWVAGATVAYHF